MALPAGPSRTEQPRVKRRQDVLAELRPDVLCAGPEEVQALFFEQVREIFRREM